MAGPSAFLFYQVLPRMSSFIFSDFPLSEVRDEMLRERLFLCSNSLKKNFFSTSFQNFHHCVEKCHAVIEVKNPQERIIREYLMEIIKVAKFSQFCGMILVFAYLFDKKVRFY